MQITRILCLFFILPPLRPCLIIGRPPPSASGHSSSVWWKSPYLRLTADQCPSPGFLSSVPYEGLPPPDLCSWWYVARVWVEGRRRRRPRDGIEFLDALTDVAWHTVPFIGTLVPLSMLVVPVYLSALPPPLSPYNCTCINTLPPNGRVFSWSLRTHSPRWTWPSCRPPERLRSPSVSSPPIP